jgi:hypothetical protein
MLITIPPAYTFGFALGAVALVAGRLRRGVLAPLVAAERQDAFFLLAIVVPLVAVILGRSTVYDGWRHVYFVYAPFVCLAVSGYAALAAGVRDRPIVRLAVFGLLGVACVATALTTVRLHPYEMVYFNAAAGPDAGRRFDGDYWGLSYRRGLEEVLRAAGPEGEVSVVLDGESVLGNRLISAAAGSRAHRLGAARERPLLRHDAPGDPVRPRRVPPEVRAHGRPGDVVAGGGPHARPERVPAALAGCGRCARQLAAGGRVTRARRRRRAVRFVP